MASLSYTSTGPGGTQVPQEVIDAMGSYMANGANSVSQPGASYGTGQETRKIVTDARQAMADLLNSRPEELVFGQNMTSLTFTVSRALAQSWQPGDEIVLSRMDHDANVSPWLRAAGDGGVTVRWLDLDRESCQPDYASLAGMLNERTRLVAITAASNAVGTVVDVRKIAAAAHGVGALVYVDGVHFTPHGLVDVKEWDVDFYACSAYKFFGPHL